MSAPQSIKDTVIWRKADELVKLINGFTNRIPNDDINIYELRRRLKNCVASIPEFIEEGFKQNTKINKIRSIIKATSSLDECKDYLALVNRMKIGNSEKLISMIDDLQSMLNSEKNLKLNRYTKH